MSELDEVDLDALQRAMDLARRDPDRAGQLEEMLKDRPWDDVAKFAAYVVQGQSLRLRLWESPPCHGYIRSPDGRGGFKTVRDDKAGALADRLLAAGLSIYEPEPVAALERAEKSRRRKRAAAAADSETK